MVSAGNDKGGIPIMHCNPYIHIHTIPSSGNRKCMSGIDPCFNFRLNCTSDSGHPAPDLAWFINGKMAEPHQLLHYPVLQHENGDQPVLLQKYCGC